MNSRKVDLAHYYPNVIKNAKEFQELADTENPEFNLIGRLLADWFNNTYVYAANEKGVERWEDMLSIFPSAEATLNERKLAIIQKITASTPYTIRRLQTMLDGGYGYGEIIANEKIKDYNLDLIITDNVFHAFQKIKDFTRSIIPANLTISISTQKQVLGQIYASGYCQTATEFELEVEHG